MSSGMSAKHWDSNFLEPDLNEAVHQACSERVKAELGIGEALPRFKVVNLFVKRRGDGGGFRGTR